MGTYLEHTRKACLTSAEDKQGFTLQAYCLWGQGPENVFYKVSSEVDARAGFGFVSKGLIAKSYELSGMRNLGHRWRLFIELRLFLCEFSSCGMGWVTVKQCGKAKLVPLFSSTGVSLCPPPFLLQRMKPRPSLSWLWVANSWANTRLPPYSSQTQLFCYRERRVGGNQCMVNT